MEYVGCGVRQKGWPKGYRCILAKGHLTNLTPSGPHVHGVAVPGKEIRYVDKNKPKR